MSDPRSPFERVVEAMAKSFADIAPYSRPEDHGEEMATILQAALDIGLLKLVEEQPEERDESHEAEVDEQLVTDILVAVGRIYEEALGADEPDGVTVDDLRGAVANELRTANRLTQAEPPSGEAPKQQEAGHHPEGEPSDFTAEDRAGRG